MTQTARTHSRLLWQLYEPAPLAQRTLAALRPFICPLLPILAELPAGARVLDIGSGNGLFLSAMARIGGITWGCGTEVSARALQTARAVAAMHGLRLEFHEVAEPAGWPEGPYDAVTMIDVMHHLPHDLRPFFVKAVAQRLRPGGRFVYKDMDRRPAWRAAWNQLHDMLLAREWVSLEPSARVRSWAEAVGLVLIHERRCSACGLYGHELMVFERRP